MFKNNKFLKLYFFFLIFYLILISYTNPYYYFDYGQVGISEYQLYNKSIQSLVIYNLDNFFFKDGIVLLLKTLSVLVILLTLNKILEFFQIFDFKYKLFIIFFLGLSCNFLAREISFNLFLSNGNISTIFQGTLNFLGFYFVLKKRILFLSIICFLTPFVSIKYGLFANVIYVFYFLFISKGQKRYLFNLLPLISLLISFVLFLYISRSYLNFQTTINDIFNVNEIILSYEANEAFFLAQQPKYLLSIFFSMPIYLWLIKNNSQDVKIFCKIVLFFTILNICFSLFIEIFANQSWKVLFVKLSPLKQLFFYSIIFTFLLVSKIENAKIKNLSKLFFLLAFFYLNHNERVWISMLIPLFFIFLGLTVHLVKKKDIDDKKFFILTIILILPFIVSLTFFKLEREYYKDFLNFGFVKTDFSRNKDLYTLLENKKFKNCEIDNILLLTKFNNINHNYSQFLSLGSYPNEKNQDKISVSKVFNLISNKSIFFFNDDRKAQHLTYNNRILHFMRKEIVNKLINNQTLSKKDLFYLSKIKTLIIFDYKPMLKKNENLVQWNSLYLFSQYSKNFEIFNNKCL